MTNDVTTNSGVEGGYLNLNQGPATKNRFAFHGDPDLWDPNVDGLRNSHVGTRMDNSYAVHADISNFRLKLNGSERHCNIADGLSREYLHDQIVARQRPHSYGATSKLNRVKHAAHIAHQRKGASKTEDLIDRMVSQIDHSLDNKNKSIFMYPLCI